MAKRRTPPRDEPLLPFGPIRNSDFFSNHWLEHRLPLEPEWKELQAQARQALDRMADLWERVRDRVERYRNEQTLEHGFIQPALDCLGWKPHYQAQLQGRRLDYALFLTDAFLDAGLQIGTQSPDFWQHPTLLADAKAWDVSLDRPSRRGVTWGGGSIARA